MRIGKFWRGILLAALTAAGGCKKEPPPVQKPAGPDVVFQSSAAAIAQPAAHLDADLPLPNNFAKWGPKSQDFWHSKISRASKQHWLEKEAQEPLEQKQADWVRKNYIRPAPAGFQPENVRRKIKLTLTPEKTMIRKGELLRYRLEIQNVGREEIFFIESPSHFLGGTLLGTWPYKFFGIRPDGKEEELGVDSFWARGGGKVDFGDSEVHFPGEEHMTQAEKDAAFKKMAEAALYEFELAVHLQPGEALVTKEWGGPAGSFLDLHADFFDSTGTYRVKVAYDDKPLPPPSEEHIQTMIKEYGDSREAQMKGYQRRSSRALGWVESNVVTIDVVP